MDTSVLVFDFFGVICSEISPRWLRQRFSPEESLSITDDIVARADTGAMPEEELFEVLAERVNTTPAKVRDEWLSLVQIDAGVVSLIGDLAHRFRIALLTNSPSPFVRGIIRSHGLESPFERILVSAEEGMAKPDPRVFQRMLAWLGVQPQQAVMIDDNPANIAGAAMTGMKGILFRSASELRQTLAQHR